jgi:F-type H+-transporting ATPase subunit a
VPKLGLKSKVVLGIILVLALMIISAMFFPVPKPGIHLSANYGADDHTAETHVEDQHAEDPVDVGHAEDDHAADTHDEESHVPPPFFTLGPIWFTNTLITSLMSVAVLALLFFFGTRRMRLVPSGLQSLCEVIVETLLNFFQSVAGEENGRRFLAVLATIFLFVITNAWMGLLPFYNVIGWGEDGTTQTLLNSIAGSVFPEYDGFIVSTAIFRPANTDINVPLVLALVSFVAVEYWGITAVGARQYAAKFFRYGQLLGAFGMLVRGKVKTALGGMFYGFIDVFVGGLELLSEFVRIISFTFRLFGNMTAGEVLLLMMAFLVPWLIAVPFYMLETMLGAIQALIFAGLSLVFATLAVTPHEHEHEHE